MKRSEMIKVLRDSIYRHLVIEYNDIMDGDSDISNVLDAIEEAGMLPPEREIPKGPFELYECSWESEDEEK